MWLLLLLSLSLSSICLCKGSNVEPLNTIFKLHESVIFAVVFVTVACLFGIHFTENGMRFQKPCTIGCVRCVCVYSSSFFLLTSRSVVHLYNPFLLDFAIHWSHVNSIRVGFYREFFVIRSYLFIMEYHESFA